MTYAVAGDISASGREILIKNYAEAFYWCRGDSQTVAEALAAAPTPVPYTMEPQGEAIAWGADGRGYYTTSEEPSGIEATRDAWAVPCLLRSPRRIRRVG
jgi:hypothetical protein